MKAKPAILITGGSSDIGLELIRAIADDGMIILAQCHQGLDRLQQLKERDPRFESLIPIQADLSSDDGISALISQVDQRAPDLSRIVHLPAQKLEFKRFSEFSWDTLLRDLEIQVKSLTQILKAFLPSMSKGEDRGKVVIMLSSVTFNVPPKFMSMYTVTKYAQLGLMRSLAAEYADRGVCINAVSPSMVETRFLSKIPQRFVEIAADQNPAKRNAVPLDVAPMIRFLLSGESNYITGANIPISAGSVF